MARTLLTAALIAAALALGATGARAQFGSIFGAPPRPPGAIPNGGGSSIPNGNPGPVYPDQGYPQRPLPPPQNYPPEGYPPQGYPPQSSARGGSNGGVQSQPLPPPPGVAVIDPTVPPSQPLPPGPPPLQRQLRGTPQPTDTSPQPGDEIVAEPPTQKVVNTTALFSGLDKITGRIINFDVAIGETVQFGALQVTPRACYTRPATELTNTDAFVEVDEVTLQGEVKRIFTGWMFAASPGLHGVEHAIYDVWLTDCKGSVQTVNATPADVTPAAPQTPAAQKPPATQRAGQPPAQPRKPAQPQQQPPPQFR